MKILKCLTLLMIVLVSFGTQAIAQENSDKKKKVKKKIVVIKKEVDENGKVTEEKIVKEGKEAEKYLEEMDIEVITKEKDGNVTVTVETDDKGKKKKGKNEDVEIRVEVRASDDGEEVEIRKEIEEIKIKLKEGKDGDVKIMEFNSWDDVPEDVKKKMKDRNIEIEKGGHGAHKVEKRVIIRGGDGDNEEEEIIINGDGEHKVIRLHGDHGGKSRVIIKSDGDEDVEIIELDGTGFSGDMIQELHKYGMDIDEDHIMEISGDPNRGYLGAKIQNEDEGKGVIITEVYKESGAAEAGLQKIDIITAIDGKKVVTVEELIATLEDKKPGDKVKIDYLRKGAAKSANVTLKKQQKNIWFSNNGDNHFFHKDANVFFTKKEGAFLGVSPADDKSDKGFKVGKVTKESSAEKAGLQKGDIITKIGDKDIKSFDDVADKIGSMKPEDKVKVAFMREGKSKEVEVTLGKHKANNNFEWNTGDGNSFIFESDDHKTFMGKMDGEARPMLGVLISDEDADKGVKLSGVTDDSGAAKAGLKKGDVLTKVAGKSVGNVKAIHEALDGKKVGDKVKVSYLRNGKENNAEITLSGSKNVMFFKTDGKDAKKKKKIIVIEKEEKKEKE